MTDPEPYTEKEEAELRALHATKRTWPGAADECAGCTEKWPCDTNRLFATLDRERAKVVDKQESVEAAFRFFIDICETLGVKPDDTEPDEVPSLIEGLVEQLVKRAEAAEAKVAELEAKLDSKKYLILNREGAHVYEVPNTAGSPARVPTDLLPGGQP